MPLQSLMELNDESDCSLSSDDSDRKGKNKSKSKNGLNSDDDKDSKEDVDEKKIERYSDNLFSGMTWRKYL